MSYGVYFKYDGERYKLPVNPEEIKKKTQKLNIEKIPGSWLWRGQYSYLCRSVGIQL